MAPHASTPSEAAAGDTVASAGTHEEQDGADEQGSPRTPAESESVAADTGATAVSQESVPGLDESSCHQRDGDAVEEESHQCHEPGDCSTQTAAASQEAREESEDIEKQPDQV